MLWKILAIGASKSSSCCSLLGFTTRFFSSRLSLILESLLATDVVKEVDLALGSILSVGLENRYCLEGGFFKLSDLIISELLHSHIFSGFTTIGECYTSVTVSRNSSSSFLSWVNVCQRFFIILSFPDSCTHTGWYIFSIPSWSQSKVWSLMKDFSFSRVTLSNLQNYFWEGTFLQITYGCFFIIRCLLEPACRPSNFRERLCDFEHDSK